MSSLFETSPGIKIDFLFLKNNKKVKNLKMIYLVKDAINTPILEFKKCRLIKADM